MVYCIQNSYSISLILAITVVHHYIYATKKSLMGHYAREAKISKKRSTLLLFLRTLGQELSWDSLTLTPSKILILINIIIPIV